MAIEKNYTFPKRFLWGASTSAHQVEGGNHNQWSVWELENAKSLAKRAEYRLHGLENWADIKSEATRPSNYVSGRAVDHYRRYEEDFDLLRAMHMNAFRFSIEWSRIEPEEGQWDEAAIEHYRQYLMALKKRKIEPMVTLSHWTIPVWFDQKGGFERRRNIDYFVRFAEKVVDELGEHFRLVCTFNEPENYVYYGWIHEGEWPPSKHDKYVLAAWVYRNIATAHNRTAKRIHRKSRRFKVGVSKSFTHFLPARRLRDKLLSRLSYWAVDEWFLGATRRQLDWIGVQYYMSMQYDNGRLHDPEGPLSDLGWVMRPDDLEDVLKRVYGKYHKRLIVTETGVADAHDQYRRWWIAHTVNAVHAAMKAGVVVDGYLHWSLLDNFEWAKGHWPRFGLTEVNRRTLERTLRPSARWFGRVIKKIRGV